MARRFSGGDLSTSTVIPTGGSSRISLADMAQDVDGLEAVTLNNSDAITAGTGWEIISQIANYRAGVMSLFISLNCTNGATAAWASVATVKAGLRPATNWTAAGEIYHSGGVTNVVALINISAATGVVLAAKYDNGTSLVSPPAIQTGDDVILYVTYVMA